MRNVNMSRLSRY